MAEITKTNPDRPKSVPNYIWILLGVLAAAAYFCGLSLPLVGPDEPRYAQVAREMLERGDWITPTLGGVHWFEKPALLYWFEMVSYKAFGVTEFAARLGPALCGLGTVAALWMLGRFLSTNDEQRSTAQLPNWLALITASTLGILVFAHGASFDIVITFTLTAALVSFFIFDQTDRKLPLVSFYFFVGMSLLAKGLIGVVFPFGIVLVYCVLSWRFPNRTLLISLLWGTAVVVVVASVWYVPVYLRNGWPFIDEFIIQHHFERFMSNKYQHPQPFYFFFWVLPVMTLPWLPLFAAAIVSAIRKAVRRESGPSTPGPTYSALTLFSASWILVPLVFFSVSGSKLPGYILPALPAAVIVTGIYVSTLTSRSRMWRIFVLSTAFGVFAGSIFVTYAVVPRYAEAESVKALMNVAAELGHGEELVYGMHTISNSAEFYAAGRLLREPDGKQKKLYGPSEVVSEMQRAGVTHALVVVPTEYQHQLSESPQINAEFLKDNGEIAIYEVTIK